MALVDKLRKARERTVLAGGILWTVRRPTDFDMVRARTDGIRSEYYFRFVTGWAKPDGSPLTEIDLEVPGGDPAPLDFDADAAAEYLSDHASVFKPLLDAMIDAYAERVAAIGDAAKN